MRSVRPGTRWSSGGYCVVNHWLKSVQLPIKVSYLQLLILLSDGCCTKVATLLKALKVLLSPHLKLIFNTPPPSQLPPLPLIKVITAKEKPQTKGKNKNNNRYQIGKTTRYFCKKKKTKTTHRNDTKTKKLQFFSAKTENGQICNKLKIPTSPLS